MDMKAYVGQGGERYALTMYDFGTAASWGFAVERKSQASEVLTEFLEYTHNQFGKYPKRIRMDNGEFLTNRVQQYAQTKGIIVDIVPTYMSTVIPFVVRIVALCLSEILHCPFVSF